MKNVFDELKTLIDYIDTVYQEFTMVWLCQTTTTINLKKSLVADVDVDGEVYNHIMEYVQLLNEKGADITFQLSCICSLQATARVKAHNSIEYKIQNYKTDKHEYGKIPINKCVNDLFGIRILLDPPVDFGVILEFVKENYQNKYRCIDSSKLDYKAVHLYFRGNNQSFPWELQIWNQCDAENNFASHRKYKQEYTTWERISKEGGTTNG